MSTNATTSSLASSLSRTHITSQVRSIAWLCEASTVFAVCVLRVVLARGGQVEQRIGHR
jgi:hypothetical protein